MKRIVPTSTFSEKDANLFTTTELKVMASVCKRFSDKTGKYIEDRSHEESAWLKTIELEDISYTLATEDPDCESSKEEIEFVLGVFNK
jgi:hypothetical protein